MDPKPTFPPPGARVTVRLPAVSPRAPARDVPGVVVSLPRAGHYGEVVTVELETGSTIDARLRDLVGGAR